MDEARVEHAACERAARGQTRERYEMLRGKSPSQVRDAYIGSHPGPWKDPAFGKPIVDMELDHIVPMKHITEMPGFTRLTTEQQLEILNQCVARRQVVALVLRGQGREDRRERATRDGGARGCAARAHPGED